MNAYLATLTVKALKEIAKRIGFRFISSKRKAELIELINAEINTCHIEAIREDKIRTQMAIEDVARKAEEARIEKVLAEHPTAHLPVISPFGTNAPAETVADPMDKVREAMTNGTAFQPAWMTNEAKAETVESTPLGMAQQMIDVLTPIMNAAHVQIADEDEETFAEFEAYYQVFVDAERAIKEAERTIGFFGGTPKHTCSYEREVGMSDCRYGCKIYRCAKCDNEREIHNATYGCRG